MTIRVINRGQTKERPIFCPMLIDYPNEGTPRA